MFFSSFFSLSNQKVYNDAHSILGYVLSTTLFSHSLSSLQHHVHTHDRRDYDEHRAVVVVTHPYQGYQLRTKHSCLQKYLRGLDHLC